MINKIKKVDVVACKSSPTVAASRVSVPLQKAGLYAPYEKIKSFWLRAIQITK
jgi:hypothetical protein